MFLRRAYSIVSPDPPPPPGPLQSLPLAVSRGQRLVVAAGSDFRWRRLFNVKYELLLFRVKSKKSATLKCTNSTSKVTWWATWFSPCTLYIPSRFLRMIHLLPASPSPTPMQTGSCFMSGSTCDPLCGDGICSGTDTCEVSTTRLYVVTHIIDLLVRGSPVVTRDHCIYDWYRPSDFLRGLGLTLPHLAGFSGFMLVGGKSHVYTVERSTHTRINVRLIRRPYLRPQLRSVAQKTSRGNLVGLCPMVQQ